MERQELWSQMPSFGNQRGEKKSIFLTVVYFIVMNSKSDDTIHVFTGGEFSGELFTVQNLSIQNIRMQSPRGSEQESTS